MCFGVGDVSTVLLPRARCTDQLSLIHACHHSMSATEHASARPRTNDAAQPRRFAQRHLYGGKFTDKVRLNACMGRWTDRRIEGHVCMHEDRRIDTE